MASVVSDVQSQMVDSSSSVPGNPVESTNRDEWQLVQKKVVSEDKFRFHDDVVNLENRYIDTEVLDNLDYSENFNIPTFEYEDDIVLDSEDEGIDGSRLIRVSSTLSRSDVHQKCHMDEQEGEMTLDFRSSDQMQCDTDLFEGEQVSSNNHNDVDMGTDSSQAFPRLSYCSSQEPGKSTQVNALNFVDNFLTLITDNPSPGFSQRKIVKVNSPPLPRIKGPQNLAKRIHGKSIEDTRSFVWDDNKKAECEFFGKREKASFDSGKKGDGLLKKYNDKEVRAAIQFQIDAAASTLPHPRLDIYSKETEGIDELDIGFSTQVAAEAMEALSSIPITNNIAEFNHCSENSLNSDSRGMIEQKCHFNSSTPQIGGIVRKQKQRLQSKRKFSANCLSKAQAHYEGQDLESALITKSKAKKGRPKRRGQLNYKQFSNGSYYSAASSNLLGDSVNFQVNQGYHNERDQVALKFSLWSHPRRKRTPRNFRSRPNRTSNHHNTFLEVDLDGKCRSSVVIKYGTAVDELGITGQLCTLSSYTNQQGFSYSTDRNLADQICDTQGSVGRIFHRTNTSRSSLTCEDYNNRTCNRNLPKSSFLKELARLGISKTMPDLKWKDVRRRRSMALVKVCFSQHLDELTIRQQKKVVSQLGIPITSSSADATHFIADKFVRTRNMLEAIALGKPVVTQSWLNSCRQASCFIDEKNYILRDTKKEKEIGFNLPDSLARATQRPLLKGLRVFVTPNIRPAKEIITNLVKASEGEPMEMSQIFTGKDEEIPSDLLVLSCEEDHINCVPFLRKGAAVYSSELLLNGIVIQKLEHKRHELFTNHTKGF